jgi:uncharacterized membrane protein YidH (DUF202 family)
VTPRPNPSPGPVPDPGERRPSGPGGPGDPGLARARTALAWTRTALSFAAIGGVVLRKDLIPGLVIMCAVPVVWRLGRLDHHRPGRLQLVTATIVIVALAALIIALTSQS